MMYRCVVINTSDATKLEIKIIIYCKIPFFFFLLVNGRKNSLSFVEKYLFFLPLKPLTNFVCIAFLIKLEKG